MTQMEALELALRLAVAAPDQERANQVVLMAEEIAAGMTPEEVATVKEELELESEGRLDRLLGFWNKPSKFLIPNSEACNWCGKHCPDEHLFLGCWYPDCPDEPHTPDNCIKPICPCQTLVEKELEFEGRN